MSETDATPVEPNYTESLPKPLTNHLARLVLAAFVVTFITARILVILIMSHRLPPRLFFHVGQTHVHHLNYGIFLLSGVGAYLLFRRPQGFRLNATAVIYGIALALTFDEFGMWVHLGGGYWQRASYDAVITITAVLGLIVYAPSWRRFRWQEKLITLLIIALLIGFGVLLIDSVQHYRERHGIESFQELEMNGPP